MVLIRLYLLYSKFFKRLSCRLTPGVLLRPITCSPWSVFSLVNCAPYLIAEGCLLWMSISDVCAVIHWLFVLAPALRLWPVWIRSWRYTFPLLQTTVEVQLGQFIDKPIWKLAVVMVWGVLVMHITPLTMVTLNICFFSNFIFNAFLNVDGTAVLHVQAEPFML